MRTDRPTPTRLTALTGAAAALIAVLALMTPAHAEAPTEPACKSDCVHVVVNGLHLSIHRPFFAYPPKEDGSDQGIFLKALLPDLVPATRENRLAVPSHVWERGWGPMLHLSFGGLRGATFESILRGEFGLKRLKDQYPVREGLEMVSSQDPYLKNDGFLLRDEKLVISCKREKAVNFPSCTEFFFYRDSLVQLSFGRWRFADWHVIHNSAIAFIDRYTIPSPSVP